jgi:dipeptidyl aminopeptidase/acylaminoacyl peptidase
MNCTDGQKEHSCRLTLLIGLVAAAVLLLFPPITVSQVTPAVTPISYALADGTRLTGYLSLPLHYQEGVKYPAVLLLHGWRGVSRRKPQGLAESYLKLKIHQKYLLQEYVVFAGEYYGDHLGDPREFQSMSAALKSMANLPQVDPRRIAVVGASHGGYLSLMCLMHPDISPKPKIGASICGVVDVAAWVKYLRSVKNKAILLPGLQQFASSTIPDIYGWPPDRDQTSKENFARISVLTFVKNLEAPLLLIHGDSDAQVPVAQAYMLRDALQREKKDVEFFEVPTSGTNAHFIFQNSALVWEKIASFLRTHL